MQVGIDGIEGIGFDLDGTLYPNHQLNLRLLPFIFKEFKLLASFGKARNIIRDEQSASDFKPGFPDKGGFYLYQAELTAKLMNLQQDEKSILDFKDVINTKIYRGWEPLFKNVKLFKDAIMTLAAFKDAGFKLGLMSDFPVKNKLDYLSLTKFPDGTTDIWDAALCSENSGALKPHPAGFLDLAKAMSLPSEKILYIGNSYEYDVIGAKNAGMKTAWIRSKFTVGRGRKTPKPDFVFRNYRQLYDFMLQ